mgnify:CR=1 FL=1
MGYIVSNWKTRLTCTREKRGAKNAQAAAADCLTLPPFAAAQQYTESEQQ